MFVAFRRRLGSLSFSALALSTVLAPALGGCAAGASASSLVTGGAGTGDAGAGAAGAPATPSGAAPGRHLTNTTAPGTGAFAGVSLKGVLVRIRALDPALVDIVTI